ncbi:MAG: hypothetical protein U0235_11100 [Polyangiaceae bacterium]
MVALFRSRPASLGLLLSISLGTFLYEGCSSDDASAPIDAGAGDTGATPDGSQPATDSGGASDVTTPKDVQTVDVAPTDASIVDANDAGADAADAAFDCAASDAGDGLFKDLRCTGLYSDWSTKTIASGVRAYDPAYALWSDGAVKLRFIYIPSGQKIDNTDVDEWVFPVGTKAWKEFRLGTQRIETRFFEKTGASTWVFTTYRWSADEQSAKRLDTGEINVNDAGDAGYDVPATGQCMLCHQGRKEPVLGFDAVSLGASGVTGTTLASLAGESLFTNTAMPTSIEIPNDSTNIARQPFGWLHANCGTACHNRNPAALANGTGLWLRVNAADIVADAGALRVKDLDGYKTAVNVTPNNGKFASDGYKRILPGNADKSLIPLLDGTRNDPLIPQMPPLASHIPPTTDVTALRNWITAMNPDGG